MGAADHTTDSSLDEIVRLMELKRTLFESKDQNLVEYDEKLKFF